MREEKRAELESVLCVTTHCCTYRGICEKAGREINNSRRHAKKKQPEIVQCDSEEITKIN